MLSVFQLLNLSESIKFSAHVQTKEGENIERALKKFKRKFEKTGVVKELRGRQAYRKPSEVRREEIKKAVLHCLGDKEASLEHLIKIFSNEKDKKLKWLRNKECYRTIV